MRRCSRKGGMRKGNSTNCFLVTPLIVVPRPMCLKTKDRDSLAHVVDDEGRVQELGVEKQTLRVLAEAHIGRRQSDLS